MIRSLSTVRSQLLSTQWVASLTARTLYTQSSLGIDGYLQSREKVKGQFALNAGKFRQKMHEFTADGSKQMVFSEDLKNMVHLAEKNVEDTTLVVKMLKKFVSQSRELSFGTYVFGPVIMRLFYYLDNADVALQCFRDKELTAFFNQWISYQILLDMLYEKGRYQDVIDAYDLVKQQQTEGGRFPRHAVVIVSAACYKLNTQQSFNYVMEMWKNMTEAGHIPMRRTATFAAGLALRQNAPHVALEILYTAKQQNYITVRNMKVLAMLDLDRTEDVVPILRSVLEGEQHRGGHSFCADVIARVRAAMDKLTDNKELKMDYERIEKFLQENGYIGEKSLDEILCAEMSTTVPHEFVSKNRATLNASFSRSTMQQRRPQRFQRPGLSELY